jgi:hypothetical protein
MSTLVAVIAGVVAIGGIAYAAIPGSNGVINGCYQKNNGNLRVVEKASDCRERTGDQLEPEGCPGEPGAPANRVRRATRSRPACPQ